MPTIQVPALTQIEVDRVFQPFPDSKTWKDGAKRGAIKAKDGVKYQCKETLLKQFTDGETCQVEVKTFGDKDNPGREIVKKVGWNGQLGVPKQNIRPRMDPTDSLEARKTSWGAAFIAAGKCPLNCDAMATMLNEIEEAARRQANPQRRDDMDDEIPNWGTNSENPAD